MSEVRAKNTRHQRSFAASTLLPFLLVLGTTLNLESTPPIWWDEGWILTIARTWIETGHYGRLLAGMPVAIHPTNGFPVVAPIALSFQLLGIGIWQGRIVAVLFTLGTFMLIRHLASRLYNKSVATATLCVLLFMTGHRDLNPILMGRQALGEMPALFYLLMGYFFFLRTLQGSVWYMALAVTFWGIALITKIQVFPFWMLSLLLPLFITLLTRHWTLASRVFFALLGSLFISQLMLKSLQLFLNVDTSSLLSGSTLYDTTAWVPIASRRRVALTVILMFGLPTLLGLGYATKNFLTRWTHRPAEIHLEIFRLALIVLSGSWFTWYLLFSVAWVRYLFPATFIGSIFVAALLSDLTDGFNISVTIKRGGAALRRMNLLSQGSGALVAVVFFVWSCSINVLELYRSFAFGADTSVLEVANFINKQTPINALIETYESELFVFLNRHYHYPPDSTHVDLNRRSFLGENLSIEYNPLEADPDYLVVGPQTKLWKLYDPVLASGEFRLLRIYSRYYVYQRVR